jgi:hypothetical protein
MSAGGSLTLRGVELRRALLFHPNSPSAQAGWLLPLVYHSARTPSQHAAAKLEPTDGQLCSAAHSISISSSEAGAGAGAASNATSAAEAQLVLEDVRVVTHCRMLREYIRACGGGSGSSSSWVQTDGTSYLWLRHAATPLLRLSAVNLTCSSEGTKAPALSPPLFSPDDDFWRHQRSAAEREPVGVVSVSEACQGGSEVVETLPSEPGVSTSGEWPDPSYEMI